MSPVQSLVALALGSVGIGAYRLYKVQKKGKEMGKSDVIAVMPWDVLKHMFSQLRHSHFTVDPEIENPICVDATVDEVEEMLSRHNFGPWNKLSYNYKGEDLNMRRMERLENGEWYQLHARVFDKGDHVEIDPHYEKCPIQHPEDHIDKVGLDDAEGSYLLRNILQREEMVEV